MACLPIARINAVPNEEIAGLFKIGVVGTHRIGLDGVVWTVTKGSNTTAKKRSTVMSVNSRTGNFEFWTELDCTALFAAGYTGEITVTAKVFPRYDGHAFGAPGAGGGFEYLPRTLTIVLYNHGAVAPAPPMEKYVAIGGSDTDPGTLAQPYATIRKAIDVIVAAGQESGSVIYLQAGQHGLSGAPALIGSAGQNRFLKIVSAPGAGGKAAVGISSWSSQGAGVKLLNFNAVTLTTGITTQSSTPANRSCWIQSCDCIGSGTTFQPTGAGSGWVSDDASSGFQNIFLTGTGVFNSRVGQRSATLVRNCQAALIGEWAWRNPLALINTTATVDAAGLTGLGPQGAVCLSIFNETRTNSIVWGFKALDLPAATAGFIIGGDGSGPVTNTDVGLVNVLVDGASVSTAECKIHNPSLPTYRVHHLVLQCHTIYRQRLSFRSNCTFYLVEGISANKVVNKAGLVPWDVEIVGFESIHQVAPLVDEGVGNEAWVKPSSPSQPAGVPYGMHTTSGNALYTDPANNNWTPAVGSPLFSATHRLWRCRIPCDVNQQIRAEDRSAIGAVRAADEKIGGLGKPTSFVYTPTSQIGDVGSALPLGPFVATVTGATPSGFLLLGSVFEAYQEGYAEVSADPDLAHFEVRKWKTGDPAISGIAGHSGWVVQDLRNGHVYISNPKGVDSSYTQLLNPLVLALNLCAPHASDAGFDGAFPIPDGPVGVRPMVRIDGDLSELGHTSGSVVIAHPFTLVTSFNEKKAVGWAKPGFGGFYPFTNTGSINKQGVRVVATVVGSNLGKTDVVIDPGPGGGFRKPNGFIDTTFATADILFKQIQLRNLWFPPTPSDPNGSQSSALFLGNWGDKSGMLRCYEVQFSPQRATLDPYGDYIGFGIKWNVHNNTGMSYDFRRVIFCGAEEHAFYTDEVSGGLFAFEGSSITPGGAQLRDSNFIDCETTWALGRSMFQMADRPEDYSGGNKPDPADGYPTTCWGRRGTIFIDRPRRRHPTAQGSGAAIINFFGGHDGTILIRDQEACFHVYDEASNPVTFHSYKTAGGQSGEHRRSLQYWDSSSLTIEFGKAKSTRYYKAGSVGGPATGWNAQRFIIDGCVWHLDKIPDQSACEIDAVEEFMVLGFEHRVEHGFAKAAISYNQHVGAPTGPQYNWIGEVKWSPHNPGVGTPICVNGTHKAPVGPMPNGQDFRIYANYPTPFTYSGFGSEKIKKGPLYTLLTEAQTNALKALKLTLPAGLTVDPITGSVGLVPTELINPLIDVPSKVILPEHITFWVKAETAAGWRATAFALNLLDSGNIFLVMPTSPLELSGLTPQINRFFDMPPAVLGLEGLVPGGTSTTPGGGGGIGVGGDAQTVPMPLGILEMSGLVPAVDSVLVATVQGTLGELELGGQVGGFTVQGTEPGGPAGAATLDGAEEGA